MSSIENVGSVNAGSALLAGTVHAPADASAELAKLESQLSEWVDCPSGKTSAGKSHIAELTGQIDAIKAQVKRTAEQQSPNAASATLVNGAYPVNPRIRLDGLGTNLDVQA